MTPRIFVLLLQLLAVARISSATDPSPENNSVNMLTPNVGVYRTMVRWQIENFMDMPYAKMNLNKNGGPFFKSELFPAQSANGVKWQFYLERNRSEKPMGGNDSSVNLMLIFQAPTSIAAFSGTCQCAILSDKSAGLNVVTSVDYLRTNKAFKFYPFFSLNELETSNDLLPDGHLTVQCIIEGHLMLNMASTNNVIPTKMIRSSERWLCGSEILQANLRILSKLEGKQVSLKIAQPVSSQTTYYYINSDILRERVPNLYLNTRNWQPSSEDFANNEELKDFLNFVLRGDADNLVNTCPRLYKFAEKYNFDCLMFTCQKIMNKK